MCKSVFGCNLSWFLHKNPFGLLIRMSYVIEKCSLRSVIDLRIQIYLLQYFCHGFLFWLYLLLF